MANLHIQTILNQVRRIQPLPDSIEAPRFIRTVIAIHLPLNNPSIESVTSLFAPFGDLTQVRVLKPGKPLPSYLKDYTPVSSFSQKIFLPIIIFSLTFNLPAHRHSPIDQPNG